MKTTGALISILLLLAIFSCENNEPLSIPTAGDGLDIYWDHEVFGDGGRTLRFEAYTMNEFDRDYELKFTTSIQAKSIEVRLIERVEKGKCLGVVKPGSGDDPVKCYASGKFYLPDSELTDGIYSLKIITPSFEVTSKLSVTNEKVTLQIPANEYLKSSIEDVYPIPSNLLFGSVVYQGSNNTNDAEKFNDYLTKLGIIKTTVPDYPYRHLSVAENGYPTEKHWEPDNHTIEFLYKMNGTDFKTIFEESKKYFNQTNLNIYLYTSNGDQGFMSKSEGITVFYAN